MAIIHIGLLYRDVNRQADEREEHSADQEYSGHRLAFTNGAVVFAVTDTQRKEYSGSMPDTMFK